MKHPSQSVARPVRIAGVSLHRGTPVVVQLRPAEPGAGRTFVRDGVAIPAVVSSVIDTRRCTSLGRDGAEVHVVEHLLAACVLAGVADLEILVDGPELPALDGAGLAWHELLTEAGVVPTGGEQDVLRILEPSWLKTPSGDFFLAPADDLVAFAAIGIADTWVEAMMAGGSTADPSVRARMLRARTYGLEAEVRALQAAGLGLGGSLDNAVIITQNGYLNDTVWPDEPAWHKALDLVGDLALLGQPLAGQVLAVRAGHAAHVALARRLLDARPAEV